MMMADDGCPCFRPKIMMTSSSSSLTPSLLLNPCVVSLSVWPKYSVRSIIRMKNKEQQEQRNNACCCRWLLHALISFIIYQQEVSRTKEQNKKAQRVQIKIDKKIMPKLTISVQYCGG